jgi:hypothetical protein
LFSWIKAAGGIAAAVLIRNRAAGVAAAVAIAVVEDLWPMRDMVLQMDRHAAFAALLSALAGAAWWGIGRGLGAAFRYGTAPPDTAVTGSEQAK